MRGLHLLIIPQMVNGANTEVTITTRPVTFMACMACKLRTLTDIGKWHAMPVALMMVVVVVVDNRSSVVRMLSMMGSLGRT